MDNTRHFEISPLTKEVITGHIGALIEMSGQIRGDYWQLGHYLADLDRKWELSSVLTCGGSVCGFIIVSERPGSLHVNRIVISEEFKRSGLGERLIDKAAEDARKGHKDYLTLKVDASNAPVREFYEKLKFEQYGTQGELLLMRLKVAE